MTIQVPLGLRHRSITEPAVALLVASRGPRVLLEFCSRLGLDPLGRIFDVAGGFLLEMERPATGPMPGAVRLRAVARASTCRSTPNSYRLSWTTRRVDWYATGAWSSRRLAPRCSLIATRRLI